VIAPQTLKIQASSQGTLTGRDVVVTLRVPLLCQPRPARVASRPSSAKRPASWVTALYGYEVYWRENGRSPRERTRNLATLPAEKRRRGEWARYQRRFEDKLCRYPILRLDVSLAFEWDPHNHTWQESLDTLAALGGVNLVDIGHRVLGRSVWAEESITEADLTTLGCGNADVLIGHDAPLHLPTLDAWMAATDHGWPPAGLKYSAEGRAMFYRGFLQVRPRLYLGGHYHRHIDELVTYSPGVREFQTRVVILDQGGSASATSQAILDVRTLGLEFITRDGGKEGPTK